MIIRHLSIITLKEDIISAIDKLKMSDKQVILGDNNVLVANVINNDHKGYAVFVEGSPLGIISHEDLETDVVALKVKEAFTHGVKCVASEYAEALLSILPEPGLVSSHGITVSHDSVAEAEITVTTVVDNGELKLSIPWENNSKINMTRVLVNNLVDIFTAKIFSGKIEVEFPFKEIKVQL